jgi:uncharacterized repeat protein (TIGR03803 family)
MGAIPFAGLIQDSDGIFYGTTEKGGPNDNGTVFKLTPSSGLITLHAFAGNDGNEPTGVLIHGSDGNLYGTTYGGGSGQMGVVFRTPPTLPVQLVSAVSRKVHGAAGTFDLDLPLTGARGIECRSGGSTGDYTLVFKFVNTLASVNGASVTSGAGSVGSKSIDGTDAHNYIVNLTGVTNAQYITVSLANVTDSAGDFSPAVAGSMGVLVGDTTGDGFVNSADISQTKSQSGNAVTNANFREDVNADGFINSADISLVKSKSGTALP